MKYTTIPLAGLTILLCCHATPTFAQGAAATVAAFGGSAGDTREPYPYAGTNPLVLTGRVVQYDSSGERLTIRGFGHRNYGVDIYNAEMITPSNASSGSVETVALGERVRIVGRLVGRDYIEADRVTVLGNNMAYQPQEQAIAPPQPAPVAQGSAVEPTASVMAVADTQVAAIPPPASAASAAVSPANGVDMDAFVSRVAADQASLSIIDNADKVYSVEAHNADIIVPNLGRAGTVSDISRGMHVHLIGEQTSAGVIQADRIRILAAVATTDLPAPVAPAAPADLSVYTGILIDARGQGRIQRSPSPGIYGPDMALVYPDRTHVPTPDEVQDELIVRYYRSEDAAEAGVGGTHPLILQAQAVIGPAADGVQLSTADVVTFQKLDQLLHFSLNWKVGFLIPADR